MATTAAGSTAQGHTEAGTGQAAGTGTGTNQQAGTGQGTGSGTGTGQAGDAGAAAGGTGAAAGTQQPAAGQAGAAGADGTVVGGKAGEQQPPKAPDKYELKRPAGDRVSDDDVAYLEKIARENKWSNEDAQAALDEHVATIEAQATRWLDETKADRDYGGEQLEHTQRLARQAVAKLRPEGHPRRDSFLRFMNRGGAGNHIEVVAFLADLGKLIGEDSPPAGRTGAPPTDPAQKMYDHPTSRALDTASRGT